MSYWVYILTNCSRSTLYVGVTNNIERRVFEHKHHLVKGFTSKYRITRLVYAEEAEDAMSAIQREKQIKGWTRARKNELVESMNPGWVEIALGQ
jgi:putative endonuclease